jgi:hypothetical protein
MSWNFFAKPKFKNSGSDKFMPLNGKRYTASKIMTLSLIATENKMYGSFNKMPYSSIMDELNLSRVTVSRNLRELIDGEIIERDGQSRYKLCDDVAELATHPVRDYHFLHALNDFGGKVVKKLSNNAVSLTCVIISTLLNPKVNNNNIITVKGKRYFKGGITGIASTINVAKSTAFGLIKELILTGVLYRNLAVEDSAGGYIIKEGKSTDRTAKTVYSVNDLILSRCREINTSRRKVKNVANNSTSTQNVRENQTPRSERRAKFMTAQQRRDNDRKIYQNLYNELQAEENGDIYETVTQDVDSDEQKFNSIEERYKGNSEYNRLKEKYKKIAHEWHKSLFEHGERAAEELEREHDAALDELETFLTVDGVKPSELPKDLSAYIK